MHNAPLEILTIHKINKQFISPDINNNISVLKNLSLKVNEGEIISIVGPSGCGKSTLLNIIAGFEKIDTGEILYYDAPIAGPSSDRGIVFQTTSLFPWLNVIENIEYGLKIKKVDNYLKREQVKKYVQYIGLEGFEEFYPSQLSGGMKQRVALARTLIMEPRLLLLDEPFAALDYHTRLEMQNLLLKMWQTSKPTVVLVTHDIEEAVLISDRVFIMSQNTGKIVREFSVPFERPRNISLIKEIEFHELKSDILSMFF